MPNVDTEATQETLGVLENALRSISWERIVMLLVLLVACMVVIKLILGVAGRAMERAKLDRGVRTFLLSGLKILLWLVALCVLLGYLGVPMTSLVAVLSVLGLAVSLAVQGLLSNLAGGIMLLSARPFSAGDFVEAGGMSGTVSEVGLVYTKIKTLDNKVVHIPNGDISTKTIVNYTAENTRRVDLEFSASYNTPVEKVTAALLKVMENHPKILADPAPMARVSEYGESAIKYVARCWCATGDYWDVYFDVIEAVKAAYEAAGVEMTYPHVNVHMVQ